MAIEQGGGIRKRRADNTKNTHIYSFPRELVVDILARVAAHSFYDLFNAKLREWNELGDDCFVYKHVSLAEFPIIQWKQETAQNKRKRSVFLQRCVDAGNLEALYRRGAVDYFQSKERGYALGCLKKAANGGHVAAKYAVCIISIYLGGEHKKDGISALSRMKESKESREEVRKARGKLVNIIDMIWVHNFLSVAPKPICCIKHYPYQFTGWGVIDSHDEAGMECKTCKCDLELSYFHPLMRLY